jgi:HD domain
LRWAERWQCSRLRQDISSHATRSRSELTSISPARARPPRAARRHRLPRQLGGAAISLDARILAVCDVYDALISNRFYREAWTHERAISLLHDEAGIKLDRRCVSALERIVTAERAPEAIAV